MLITIEYRSVIENRYALCYLLLGTIVNDFETLLKVISTFLANVNSCSRSLYVVVGPSVVCRLSSVTFVHPTQAIEIFGNVSTPFGTLAICDPPVKILRRSSQGNPSVEG